MLRLSRYQLPTRSGYPTLTKGATTRAFLFPRILSCYPPVRDRTGFVPLSVAPRSLLRRRRTLAVSPVSQGAPMSSLIAGQSILISPQDDPAATVLAEVESCDT